MIRASRGCRRWWCALFALQLALLAFANAATAEATGSVEGEVTLFRKKLFGKPTRADEVRDVVVYLTGFASAAPAANASLDQHDEQFAPRLLPIVAGQRVEFPNRDRIYHNVFSVSPLKPFDLGQYKSSDTPQAERFDQPGLVPVYCNIHPHMIAYLVVLENAAYALASADGSYALRDVPPGRHVLHAWTPGAEAVHREIEIRAGERLTLDLELVAGLLPKHKRKDGSEYPPPGSELER